MSGTTPIPLAIVGMSCRFPGGVTSTEELWDFLVKGKSAWSKVPADRWNEQAFWHPDPDDTNGTNNHSGGHFLSQDLGEFDAGFFNVTPQEASSMDPQQRLLLETTYEALESAGMRQEQLQKSNTAVYMAIFTRDYDRNVYKDVASIPKYHVTGTGDAILANRISHLFDLRGPSVTLDTGCSGGMAAIVHACEALRSRKSDMALAGAVNLILTPDHMIGMSNLHMLNDNGRSFSFDSRGAGYGRGEAVATLVIKRLDDAIKANDPIRAIIRDAAINQDGHTSGITNPSGAAQQALERKVWNNIGLHTRDVGYVEAHGTGTLAGDSAELDGISKVFCEDRGADSPLLVGSIKSNIGHTECASGLASMIKSVLILENGAIPPNVNFEQPRASLNLEQKKIKVPTALLPWTNPGTARISVNSFGYGGTNGHAVLERPASRPREDASVAEDTVRLFIVSAANQVSLLKMLTTNADWVSKHADQSSLRDLSYTLAQRRSILPWRFSCVASNQQELLDALAQGSQKTDAITRITPGVKISFVFTGQGAQWAGMGRELLSNPIFNSSIQQSNQVLRDLECSWDLVEELIREEDKSRLKEAELAQPATTAIQIALVDLARHWGIHPSSVIGHSSGEIGAAYSAGYLTQYQALKVAYVRGFSAAISKKKGLGKGGMLAVGVGEEDVAPFLSQLNQGVATVACQNSPNSTTVSGDDAAISELSDILTEQAIFNKRLNIETAYHSHHMQAAASEYKAGLTDIVDGPVPTTGVEMFSSVTGSLKSAGFGADYWTANLVGKVRFCEALQTMCQSEYSHNPQHQHIFIEMGPHCALAGPARQCIADLPVPMLYSYTSGLVRGANAVQTSLAMVGHLFNQGYPIDLAAVSGSDPTSKNASVLTNLPSYSWDHNKRYWHESRISKDYRFREHGYHDLLGLRMTDHTPLRPTWRHMVGVGGLPWLADHVVDGLMIFPGSGYMTMAVEAASQLVSDRHPGKKVGRFCLKDVYFLKGLVIPEGRARVEVQLSFNPIETVDTAKTMHHSFSVNAYTSETWNEYCRGDIVVEFTSEDDESQFRTQVTYGELNNIDATSSTRLEAGELYQELERVGNAYGPTFTGIQELTMDADRASSRIVIPNVVSIMPARHIRPHVIHPSTLDILLHTTLPLVNQKLGAGSVMPVHIDIMAISPEISNVPGNSLSAITTLTSSHFRAAEADLEVFAGEPGLNATPLISATGMQLRSLASGLSDHAGMRDGRDICYELKWSSDERFLSAKQLQASQPLYSNDALSHSYALMAQYLKHKAFKQSCLSIIELGGSTTGATTKFLEALKACGANPDVYDFTSEDASYAVQSELEDWAGVVNVIESNINDELDQGLDNKSYDIVFACNTLTIDQLTLSNVHKLLKPDGVLLLISNASLSASEWSDALSQASFKMQLTAQDNDSTPRSRFIVARAIGAGVAASLPKIIIVSEPSLPLSLKAFVTEASSRLGNSGVNVSTTSWDNKQPNDNAIHVVIDDGSKPLLAAAASDRFRHVVDLLQGRSSVVWVSAQDNEQDIFSASKHLINGLARTALAENEDLEMVTIDVQQKLDHSTQSEILDFIYEVVQSFGNSDVPREREYVYTGADVLVPRLLPHVALNRQVSGNMETLTKIEPFTDSRIVLKLDLQKSAHGYPIFVENKAHLDPLEQDHVEIETKAFGVTSPKASQSGATFNEYAGVITATGSGVSAFRAGDRVVALSIDSCGNRIRVPATQAQLLPSELSFTTAATLPLSFMTASYVLNDIANLQPGQIVLVDGATSELGQAAMAVAQYLGAEVIAAVSRVDEVTLLRDSFNMPLTHIVPRQSHFSLRRIQKISGFAGVDIILGCAMSPVDIEMSQAMKPFGKLVHVRGRGNDSKHRATMPPFNATVATFDLDSLLQVKPQMATKLLEQVVGMIHQGLSVTSQKVTAVPMNDLENAFRMAQQDSMDKCALEVQEDSIVHVARPGYTHLKLEANATYVVGGGLGDLGKRLMNLMSKAGAIYLVTLSRQGASPEEHLKIEQELKEINPDCSLLAIRCDVSQRESVEVALSKIKANGFPSVKGVIQAAVVLRDSTLGTMTAEIFDTVLQTKARGTSHLQQVFDSEDLTFFITLSSVMNIIGGKGQANYNAGNSFQDALAQFDRRSNCFNMSLNIGGIEDATVNNEAIIQSIRRQGLTQITNDELLAYFEYALSADAREAGCHQPVIGFTAESIAETTAVNGAAHSLMFTHVRRAATADADDDIVEAKTFKNVIAETADKEEISAFVAQSIANGLADLIAINPADVNLGFSISDYGLDSLIAIELRNWLMREFDAPIQSSEVLDSSDIWTLAQKVTMRSRLVNGNCDPTSSSSSDVDPVFTLPVSQSYSSEVLK